MRQRLTFISLCGVVALLLAGCGQGSSSSSGEAGPPGAVSQTASGGDKKQLDLAFVTNNVSDFWTYAQRGTEEAAKEDGHITVDFKKPPTGAAAEQVQIINDLVAKGVNGIAISAKDPANETELINKTAKNIIVITQDSDAPNSDRACYIGTDNIQAGREAGDELKKALPNGGKVMCFVGSMDVQNAKERFQGLQEAIKGTKIDIIDTRTDETDRARAVSNVSDAVVAHPDLAACVGLWSYNGPAILTALKQANKLNQIKIVCFDEEDQTLQGVKDGYISATIVQQPFEFGKKAIQVMAAYDRGDKSLIPADKKIIVPTRVIDKSTVDEFMAYIKKLKGGS